MLLLLNMEPQPTKRIRARRAVMVLAPLTALTLAALSGRHAKADDPDRTAFNERCATRLSIALLGKSADATLLGSQDPQSNVETMLGSADFNERFASFINSQMNSGPSSAPKEDAVYYLAKHVLTQRKPWKDLFVGPYKVDIAAGGKADDQPVVTDDPSGLGFFRSPPWLVRYAGNESEGLKLSTAFHILNSTTGLELIPSVAKPGEDRTATGRSGEGCKTCHFDGWYALDKVANVLSRKQVDGDGNITFSNGTFGPPQQLLGKTIANDKELVETLVNSESFIFNSCRLVFRFMYGRAENTCEAPLFDQCADALEKTGSIQSAVGVLAKDKGFCQ